MPKRKELETEAPSKKRLKSHHARLDRLSSLSDELLLRIFSFVSENELAVSHRVSRRIGRIAGDSQLWRGKYYERFMLPRLRRRRSPAVSNRPNIGIFSGLSRWLDEANLFEGKVCNWKKQYKLSHNWAIGNCVTNEIPLETEPSNPTLLAKLHDGIIYTAGSFGGLQALSYKDDHHMLARHEFADASDKNTALSPLCVAVDTSGNDESHQIIILGFDDGTFAVYQFHKISHTFRTLLRHCSAPTSAITDVAFYWPYLLCMTDQQILHLYSFQLANLNGNRGNDQIIITPRLLNRLRSYISSPPVSLRIRVNQEKIFATIAYCRSTIMAAHTVAVQEIQLTVEGEVIISRMASASQSNYTPLSLHPQGADYAVHHAGSAMAIASTSRATLSSSVSYAHPYLLISHPDNTMTIYLVTSNDAGLTISSGRRLWGHTSSVFEAQVGRRGKAVSVSNKGDEIRVWELERTLTSRHDSQQLDEAEFSVRVVPRGRTSKWHEATTISAAIAKRGSGLGLAGEYADENLNTTRGWVGFDEENVVVLREQRQGTQALTVYDFT